MKISMVSMPVQDPVAAHEIYTSKLGFISKVFDSDASLAVVVSSDFPDGTELLLEPCQGSFAATYQQAAYEANLPIMVFSVNNVHAEMDRLKAAGIVVRPDLDKPEWGLKNLFEDGCGNLIMIQESSA